MATSLPPRHVVFLPHPGRGHVNPMLNFCKLIASRRRNDIHLTFIVTEEWLGLLTSEANLNPDETSTSIAFATIPNVLPSELVRGSNLLGFLEAVQTDVEGPVEQLLDTLDPPPDLIVADSFLTWAVGMGERRAVPVASFWPASPSSFSAFYHHQLILSSLCFPLELSGNSADERVDFIPGIPSIRLADLPGEFQTNDKRGLNILTRVASSASKAQCIIFRTINELDGSALTALRDAITPTLYPVGPAIPYFTATKNKPNSTPEYMKWLDAQRKSEVLYISLGSFLSASSDQVRELAAGLKDSGIPFLWVARDQTNTLSAVVGEKGMVVTWCDQMRVLTHPCIGGFLTHCGWNSSLEAAFAGVPALTLPLGIDQTLNSKIIVEDWGIGWRVRNKFQDMATRAHILALLKKFMDLEDSERKELDRKAKNLKERLLVAVAEDGSTSGLDEFPSDFLPTYKNK